MALTNLKLLLQVSDSSQDGLLGLLQTNAGAMVCAYINQVSVPAELEWVVDETAALRYRRMGAEGKSSENVGEVSASFEEAGIPAHLRPILDSWVAVDAGLAGGTGRLRML
jgi:hypothetical protein